MSLLHSVSEWKGSVRMNLWVIPLFSIIPSPATNEKQTLPLLLQSDLTKNNGSRLSLSPPLPLFHWQKNFALWLWLFLLVDYEQLDRKWIILSQDLISILKTKTSPPRCWRRSERCKSQFSSSSSSPSFFSFSSCCHHHHHHHPHTKRTNITKETNWTLTSTSALRVDFEE